MKRIVVLVGIGLLWLAPVANAFDFDKAAQAAADETDASFVKVDVDEKVVIKWGPNKITLNGAEARALRDRLEETFGANCPKCSDCRGSSFFNAIPAGTGVAN